MGKIFTGWERMDLFAQEVLAQISAGKKETVSKIIEELEKKNVVHYLYSKYKDEWALSLDGDSPYSVDDWEEKYYQYSYISMDDARRKWGIQNEDDGLLLLVSLTFEVLREALY